MPLIYKQSPLFHHRINVRFAQTFPAGLRRCAAQSGGKEKRVLFPLTLPKRLTPHSGVNHSKGGLCANPLSSKRATPLCGVAPLSAYFTYMGIQLSVISQTNPFYHKDSLPFATTSPAGLRRYAAQSGGREPRPCTTYPPRTACAAMRASCPGDASLRQPFFKRATPHSGVVRK